jgi:filamentous hemagglutinin family protein
MHPDSVVYRMSRTWLTLLCCFFLLCTLLLPASHAQMTLDGSLGPRGPLPGPNYRIPAEVGQLRGGNLFHSFGQFNIQRSESATFTGPASVANIFSRVTGGNPSVIDGRLQSTIPGANVYLLNPTGVLFGPNASLDISGSFHVSTANVIRFRDGATFSANLADTSTLTVAPPVAFGFLDSHPAGIAIQGSQLRVDQGKTFAITGGDITMTASPAAMSQSPSLRAPSGRIALTSVASPGDVQVEAVQGASRLLDHTPPRLGAVLMTDSAQVTVSGTPGGTILVEAGALTLTNGATLSTQTSGALPGGDILVRAQALTLRTGSGMIAFTAPRSAGDAGNVRVEAQTVTIRDGSFIASATQGAGRGGNVMVTADTLVMDGSLVTPSQIATTTSAPGSAGDAGSVRVDAQTVTLTNGAQIQSGTLGAGRGGNVTVMAQGAVSLDGFGTVGPAPGQTSVVPSLITASSQPGSTGDAGSVQVDAQTVTLTKGAQIQSGTAGSGRGGNVTVIAQGAVSLDGFGGGLLSLITASSLPQATGDAGNVRVEAQTVTATNGAQISSSTFRAGQGGNVTVMARERVTFRGTSPEGETLLGVLVPGERTFPSGATVNSQGAGAPGIVQVSAPEVMLAEGGRISSLNIASERAGGTVIVQAPDILQISGVGSSLRTRSFGPGRGGDIAVHAGTVLLTAGADLSAASIRTDNAGGSGDAGNVTVTVRKSLLIQNSFVTTEAAQAAGGDITLRVQDVLRLRNSAVTATVGGGPETVGGNITIDPQFIILESSQIRANAFEGRGGNIQIQAQQAFLADPASQVSASSTLGINGQVAIQSPVTSLSGAVAPLPQAFAQTAELLRSRCAERLREGTVSRLVVGGRDGVPLEPGSLLPSPLAQTGQAGVVHEEEQGSYSPEALHGGVGYAQAQSPEGPEVECGRWRGQPKPPATPKRRR